MHFIYFVHRDSQDDTTIKGDLAMKQVETSWTKKVRFKTPWVFKGVPFIKKQKQTICSNHWHVQLIQRKT